MRAAGICAAHLRRNDRRNSCTRTTRYGSNGACAEGPLAGVNDAQASCHEGAFAWVVRDASFGARLQGGQVPVQLLGLSPLPASEETPLTSVA